MEINRKTIIKDDNPLIRQKSLAVPLPLSAEDKELIEEMFRYVDESTIEEVAKEKDLQPAVGISAVQVGILKKIFVIVLKNEKGEIEHKFAFVNPKILSESVEKIYLDSGEGCLSVPINHQGHVLRARRIKIRAYDYFQDKEITLSCSDYLAIVMQHEYDHLKGVLYYDHIAKQKPFIEDETIARIETE